MNKSDVGDLSFHDIVENALKDRIGAFIKELVRADGDEEREFMAKTSIAVVLDLMDELGMLGDGGISGIITMQIPKRS